MTTDNTATNKLLDQISELEDEIFKLKKRKRYGLVWENKPEIFEKKSKNALPVLKEKGGKFKDIIDKGSVDDEYNILIEGDNYHSLSVLNYTHRDKIDVIYIDPPYNTGNKDFIYNDHYVDKEDSFRHSKWLSFMSKRLRLAKNLLQESGVIFISIDDNEQAQLKLLCDEVFGEENFINKIIWKKTENIKMDSRFLSQNKDYVLCYRKSEKITEFQKEHSDINRYKLSDEVGLYYERKLDSKSSAYRKTLDYVINYDGINYYAGGSKKDWEKRQKGEVGGYAPRWLWSEIKYKKGLLDGDIIFKNGKVYNKVRHSEEATKPYIDIQTLVSGQTAQKELDDLFGKRMFDHPKPPQLIEWLINLIPNNKNSIILDFMAGSGTTGHAVLDLNNTDGGNRKFILCTNNENNIAEDITWKRIKKVATGYKDKTNDQTRGLGSNLKYLKTDFVKMEENSDDLKEKMVEASTEILCLKENTFNLKKDTHKKNKIKVFENKNRYTAILFDLFYFDDFIAELKKLSDKKVSVYVFSYTRDFAKEEFGDLAEELDFTVEAIPEKVLETYKKIFNF